jgi:hypothetical protein
MPQSYGVGRQKRKAKGDTCGSRPNYDAGEPGDSLILAGIAEQKPDHCRLTYTDGFNRNVNVKTMMHGEPTVRENSESLGSTSTADVGVLFVHGIGDQPSGQALAAFGRPVLEALREMLAGIDEELAPEEKRGCSPSSLDQQDLTIDGQSVTRVSIAEGDRRATWLLSEAWWAESFQAPRAGRLARWLLLAVPWTLYRHALSLSFNLPG